VGAAAAGRLGSAAGLGAGPERERLRHRYRRPPFRLDAAAVLARVASAAIDVSDGLLQDLGHLADASGVGVRLRLAAVPLAFGHPRDERGPRLDLAFGGGEDYELLAAVPPGHAALADRLCAEAGVGLYEIGEAVHDLPAGTLVGVAADGSERPLERRGFRHFG
jgi:thiamine-monophosphate kinase